MVNAEEEGASVNWEDALAAAEDWRRKGEPGWELNVRSGAIGQLLVRAVRMEEGPGLSLLQEPRVCEQIARVLQVWRNEGHRGNNRDGSPERGSLPAPGGAEAEGMAFHLPRPPSARRGAVLWGRHRGASGGSRCRIRSKEQGPPDVRSWERRRRRAFPCTVGPSEGRGARRPYAGQPAGEQVEDHSVRTVLVAVALGASEPAVEEFPPPAEDGPGERPSAA